MATSFSDLGVSALLNGCVIFVLLILFSIFVRQPANARVYYMKWFLVDPKVRTRFWIENQRLRLTSICGSTSTTLLRMRIHDTHVDTHAHILACMVFPSSFNNTTFSFCFSVHACMNQYLYDFISCLQVWCTVVISFVKRSYAHHASYVLRYKREK